MKRRMREKEEKKVVEGKCSLAEGKNESWCFEGGNILEKVGSR